MKNNDRMTFQVLNFDRDGELRELDDLEVDALFKTDEENITKFLDAVLENMREEIGSTTGVDNLEWDSATARVDAQIDLGLSMDIYVEDDVEGMRLLEEDEALGWLDTEEGLEVLSTIEKELLQKFREAVAQAKA